MNFYDAERKVLEAHDKVNKVSREYRPELLDDKERKGRRFHAQLLGGLGEMIGRIGYRLHDRYKPLPNIDDTSKA